MNKDKTETTKKLADDHLCQKHVLELLREPERKIIPPPLSFRVRRSITKRLSPRHKKMIKRNLSRLFNSSKATAAPTELDSMDHDNKFKPGDLVRIRSLAEIRKTLDAFRQLKGCTFVKEMEPLCGTTQKVLKPIAWFFDECDQKLKKAKGMVLLENIICLGSLKFGPCDRSCFYFWRVEWLEKI